MTIKVDAHGLTVQAARPNIIQNVVIGAGNLQSAPFAVGNPGLYGSGVLGDSGVPVTQPLTTMHVRLCATSDCYVAFGSAPVASATAGMLLPAGIPEYFWVYPGERVGVIQSTGAGSLNVVEMVA